MKNTINKLTALALGIAIIGTGVTGAYAYQNQETINKFIPSFSNEDTEAPETTESEAAESAKLAPLAKITTSQAKTTALANHSGNINNVVLEDENGTIVYGLEYANGDEVKVDATTGDVVTVEKAGEEDANDTEDDANEAPETAESEAAESAKLAPLAKITTSQAKTTALTNHSGNINNVVLEDENGTIVYGVEYSNGDEVKIDAKTGKVVKIEKGGEEHMDHIPHTEREREDIEDNKENENE